MTRELGLNPKKFGGLANTRQEPWKLPLPEFIEKLYFKHFNRRRPDVVRSIEQMVSDARRKSTEHGKERQRLRNHHVRIYPHHRSFDVVHHLHLSRLLVFSAPRPPIPVQLDDLVSSNWTDRKPGTGRAGRPIQVTPSL